MGERTIDPAVTTLVVAHGSLATAWFVLFLVQAALIPTGRRRVHMRLGWATAGVALGVAVSGSLLAVASARLTPDMPFVGMAYGEFLMVMLAEMVVFAAFAAAGILWRRRPERHRAMMLLASLSILAGATVRMPDLPSCLRRRRLAGALRPDLHARRDPRRRACVAHGAARSLDHRRVRGPCRVLCAGDHGRGHTRGPRAAARRVRLLTMQPAQRLLAVAIAVASLAACGRRKGFDEMNLRVEEVGNVPLEFVLKPPAHVGEITSWRTDLSRAGLCRGHDRSAVPPGHSHDGGSAVQEGQDRAVLQRQSARRARPWIRVLASGVHQVHR